MNFITTILFMVVIGAAIGGVTNYIAIKMLFRPYKAVYIGHWRVPFTPGLIPKRRDELAYQLGNLVVDHLLTPESLKKRFANAGFQNEITEIVRKKLDQFFQRKDTIEEFLEGMGFKGIKRVFKVRLNNSLEKKFDEFMNKNRQESVKSMVPDDLLKKADERIPEFSSYILQKGIDYFSSVEGEIRVRRMVDDFLNTRGGMMANMLQMLLGNINMTEKIQKEIIKFLESEGTTDLVSTLIRKEWERLLDLKLEDIEEQFSREKLINTLQELLQKIVQAERIFDKSICDLSASIREEVLVKGVPILVNGFKDWILVRIEDIMRRLQLADIVKEQVESFSVERLEAIVLLIARRELKMITYLGALLGGAIGLLQGVFVHFI